MRILAALLLLGTAWADAPRVDYAPKPGGDFQVRLRFDGGTAHNEVCGLIQVSSSVPIISWPAVSGEVKRVDLAAPSIPGMPDLVLQGYCENAAGRVRSVEVGCLDAGQDCERRCGDLHFDYRISLADFVIARELVADPLSRPEEPWCDTDSDQDCSLSDFIRIRQAAAGAPVVLEQACPGRMP